MHRGASGAESSPRSSKRFASSAVRRSVSTTGAMPERGTSAPPRARSRARPRARGRTRPRPRPRRSRVERVGRRRHVREVELGDDPDGLEDLPELPVKRSTSSSVSASRARRATWSTSSRAGHVESSQKRGGPPSREPAVTSNASFVSSAAATTFAAWAPLGPWTTSNSTLAFGQGLEAFHRDRGEWTKTSSTTSRSMKP